MNESENLVPKRRFKEFTNTGTWGQRKSKEICTISTGKGNTQDKIDDGKYPFYVRSATIERSNDYLYDQEAVLTVGDGVGTGKVFHYVNGKYNLHQRVYRMFDFNNEVSAKYFYYYFSKKFYRRVMAMTAKTSVDSVRLEMIADMIIEFPSPKEQQKIVKLFESLDDAIALHQRKLDKTKSLKSAYLLEMFPAEGERKPKRRFAGFTDDWKQRELGDIADVIDPHPSHRAPEKKTVGIPFVGIGDVDEEGNINYSSVRIVDETIYDEHYKRYDLKKKSIGIGRVASLGKIIRLRNDVGKYAISPTMAIIQFDIGVKVDYMYSYMNTPIFQKQFASYSSGSTRQSVGIQDLRKLVFYTPVNVKEQALIGVFFQNLDHSIALHQHKLEKLKNIKQAYLNELFV